MVVEKNDQKSISLHVFISRGVFQNFLSFFFFKGLIWKLKSECRCKMNRRPKIVYNANPSCEGHCVPTLHAGSEEIPFLHNPHVRGGGHNLKFLFCAKMHSTVTQSSGFFKFNFLIQNSLCLCADFVLNWL